MGEIAEFQRTNAVLAVNGGARSALSADANLPAYRINQPVRIEGSAIFENDFDIFDVRDARRRIAFDQHQIRTLSRRQRSDVLLATEEARAVLGGYVNSFNGAETRFNQEFDLPLIAEPWQNSAVPGGIRTRE